MQLNYAVNRLRHPRRAARAIGLAVVVTWGAMCLAAGAFATPADVRYRGKAAAEVYTGSLNAFPGSSEVKVTFERNAKRGTFRASGVKLFCDDLTRPRIDLPSIPVSFITRRRFAGFRYTGSPASDQTYYVVRGRVNDHRKAIGRVIYISDPFEAPYGEYVPDCRSPITSWKASHGRR